MSAPARPVTELPRTVPVGLARRTLRAVQRVRTTIVFGILLVLFGVILARLGKLQLIGGAAYREEVEGQKSFQRTAPLRAALVDSKGRALAISRPVRNVLVEAGGVVRQKGGVLDLTIDDVPRFAATLSGLLDGIPSAKEIRAAIERRRVEGPFGRSGSSMIVIRKGIDDPRVAARLEDARPRLAGLVVK